MKKATVFTLSLLGTSLLTGCAWQPWNTSDSAKISADLRAHRILPHARIQHGGDSAAAFYTLGRHLQREGKLDDAERAFLRTLDFDSTHQEARNALAVIAASRGDITQAIKLLSSLAASHPDQPHLLANLGYAHYLNGDYRQAKQHLVQALALAPDNESVRQKLVLVNERLGEPEDEQGAAAFAKSSPVRIPEANDGLERNPVIKLTEGVYQLIRPLNAAAAKPHVAQCELPEQPSMPPPKSAVSASAETPLPVAANAESLRIELANGNGIRRMARTVRDLIAESGTLPWRVVRVINYDKFSVPITRIEYARYRYEAARELAGTLGVAALLRPNYQLGDSQLRVVLGRDFPSAGVLRERLASGNATLVAGLE